MATARFRHSNSPEEIAKREARPEGAVKDPVKGFRHYNHPEEVAKREAEARGGGWRPTISLPSPAAAVAVQNAAAAVVVAPGPVLPAVGAQPSALVRLRKLEETVRGLTDDIADLHASRDDGLESLLIRLFGSPEELQALRVMVQNFPGVQESQLELGNRLVALERSWDLAFEGEDEADETEPPPPPEAEEQAVLSELVLPELATKPDAAPAAEG